MKCDVCGEEIGKDATVDSRSVGPSSEYRGNETVKLTMCAACAESRCDTQRTLSWAFALFVPALILAALLVSILARELSLR